uniref:Uncharacterized protein n=1 Tax=Angiostrongylus cantonensis TaxID=6313 RepID=A0A0K0DLF5_ANGCA
MLEQVHQHGPRLREKGTNGKCAANRAAREGGPSKYPKEADGPDVRRDVGRGVERHVLPEVVPEDTGPEEAATFHIVAPGLKKQFLKCRY